MNKHSTVYGKYSLGSGEILSDADKIWDEIDAAEVISSYQKSLELDFERAGLSLEKLKTWKVMDVGTGRQTIAFNRLGAKSISHYDISPENVENMQGFINRNSLQEKISSECVDLVECRLPKNEFDFIYLNGIVQHFSNVGAGLRNCLEALKPGGYLWLYFYRSGTFLMFVINMIRDLIKDTADLKVYFANSLLLYSDRVMPNFHTSNIMDDFFVPYINLYTPASYITFLGQCGLEIISSSKLDPLGKDVDHKFAHPSTVITCRKVKDLNLENVDIEGLSPEKNVNQLRSQMYSSKEIFDTLLAYNELREIIATKQIPSSIIMSIAFCIYRFVKTLDSGLDAKIYSDHRSLQNILKNATSLLKKEF